MAPAKSLYAFCARAKVGLLALTVVFLGSGVPARAGMLLSTLTSGGSITSSDGSVRFDNFAYILPQGEAPLASAITVSGVGQGLEFTIDTSVSNAQFASWIIDYEVHPLNGQSIVGASLASDLTGTIASVSSVIDVLTQVGPPGANLGSLTNNLVYETPFPSSQLSANTSFFSGQTLFFAQTSIDLESISGLTIGSTNYPPGTSTLNTVTEAFSFPAPPPASTPEPTTLALTLTGGAWFAGLFLRRRRGRESCRRAPAA